MTISPRQLEELAAAAKAAIRHSYSPYSRFPVGAAVFTRSGRVYAAANVENASYSVTICAERIAAAQAVTAGERDIVAIAIYTPTPGPTMPCGTCRQFLSEFNPAMDVLCLCEGTALQRFSLRDLFPDGFTLKPAP